MLQLASDNSSTTLANISISNKFHVIMEYSYHYFHFSDIFIALLSVFIVSSIHEKLTRKGPMIWPVIGMLPSLLHHFADLYDWITRTLIRYGGTIRYKGIWRGGAVGILTSDPSKLEYILKTNFKNFPKGTYYKERFNDLLGDGIFNADDDLWKQQRRAATAEMHTNRFVDYSFQSMRDLVHDKLLKLVENAVRNTSVIDLQDVLLRFTFDNICTAAFGVDAGCLSTSTELPDVPFAKAFEDATENTLFRFCVPPVIWKPMRYLQLGFEKRLEDAVKIVHDFADKTVKQRKTESYQQLDDRSDLLSRLISLENAYFSDKLLKDFCISFILAGRDTSSVGLAWFFWLLHNNPRVENKIVAEIHDVIKTNRQDKKVVNYKDVVFSVDELKSMVYLQAALSESLRLYPPVSIDFKQVLEDDVLPGGTRVKGGERIIYCIYSMGRMESVWGKDCLEFKPERWIKEGEFVSGNQFKYAVFNGGPRLCIGKKFAYMQMKMVAASLLLRYCVKVVDDHQVVPKVTTTLYMKNGLMVTLEPRSY